MSASEVPGAVAPTARVPGSTSMPLTPFQRALLGAGAGNGNRSINLEQIVGELAGPLDIESFRAAWQQSLQCCDALRLRLIREGAAPRQQVVNGLQIPFHVLERTRQPSREALEQFLARDRQAGFELSRAPLMRVAVLELGERRWAFIWTVHRIIIDRGAYANLLRFVFSGYERIKLGQKPAAWTAPSYAEFMSWLCQQDQSRGRTHFRELLTGFRQVTELPYQTGSRRVRSKQTRQKTLLFTQEQTRAIDTAARSANVAPGTVLQLAWGLCLARYSGKDDVLFGVTWPGRGGTLNGAGGVAGTLCSVLPARVDLRRAPSVRQALSRLQSQQDGLTPFQHVPVEEMLAVSELSGASRLYNTTFSFEEEHFIAALERDNAQWRTCYLRSRSQAGGALEVVSYQRRDRMHLSLVYDTGLYSESTAAALAENYARLVVNMCRSLDANVHHVHLFEPAEFRRITQQQVHLERVPTQKSALSRVLQTSSARPESVAIQASGGAQVTYDALAKRALDLADCLVRHGVQPGDIVAVLVPRSIDAIVSMLGVHAAGAAFVLLEPSHPKRRLQYLLRDCRARLVLVNSQTQNRIRGIQQLCLPLEDSAASASNGALPVEPTPADGLAYVSYTSCSSGKPKAVAVAHAALANHLASVLELFELTPLDRVLQFSNLSSDASLEEIFPALAAGATLVIAADDVARNAALFFESMASAKITVLNLPTAFWHQLVDSGLPWPDDLRLLMVGGERLDAAAHAKFRSQNTHQLRFINGYGPTETTITSTVYDDQAGDHSSDDVPIGAPLQGLSHYVLDSHQRPMVFGAVGQLFIGGAGLAKGYLFRERLTSERFVPHPWRAGARLYATGDLVRQTESGNYVYVGRIDDQVKVRGVRIELGEVEACLRTHEAVEEAAVVQSAERDSPGLVGFAAVNTGSVSGEQLCEHLATSLPDYMVPSQICVEPELPKTPTGGVDRQALIGRIVASASAPDNPRTDDLEQSLLTIWSELLGVAVTDPRANFFELGGNSLLAVQMFTQVERRLGKSCRVTEFFKQPTVAILRSLIENHDGTDWQSPRLHLASGKPGADTIFFAPSVTGRVVDYVHIAEVLGKTYAVYALQIRGLQKNQEPHTDLSAAANYYADLMQEVQPVGPYAVAGYSAGGTICLAIAEVLHDRGEHMAFVGLLDAEAPVPVLSPFTSLSRFVRFARTASGRVRELLQEPGWANRLWARGRSALQRSARAPSPTSNEPRVKVQELFAGGGAELTEEELPLMQAHLETILAYSPKHYPIDVVLLRTHLDPFDGPHEPDLGWSRAVTGTISIREIPCTHHELLTREGAPRLAKLMECYLSRSGARSASGAEGPTRLR